VRAPVAPSQSQAEAVPGIGVVVNPHAAGNRAAGTTERLRAIVGGDGCVLETPDLASLDAAIRALRERAVDIFAVCGGDGSYFRTFSSVIRAYGEQPLPLLLPLRAGTMNTAMRSIGGSRRRAEAMLAHVVSSRRQGRGLEVFEHEVMAVDDRYYGFMFGSGPIVNFLRLYYAGSRRGPARAAWLILRLALSALLRTSLLRSVFQPVEAEIVCDGERVPFGNFHILYASTLVGIGLGFRPTYLATRKRGHFHLLAGPLPPGELLRKLWRIRLGFPLESPRLYDNLARRIVVEFPSPTQYMIDGDILGPTSRLVVEAGPRLQFIRG
jgi:diacylglycerol kinase family enzyme